MIPSPYEQPERRKAAFDVTVQLGGTGITFRCMGSLIENTGGKWRLDLARPMDPVPPGLTGKKEMAVLCESLTDELSAVLECRVTRVQPDRVVLEW